MRVGGARGVLEAAVEGEAVGEVVAEEREECSAGEWMLEDF